MNYAIFLGADGGHYAALLTGWAQSLAAGTVRKLLCPIDNAHCDATPGKVTRERQAGRAGAHHEDIYLRHAPIKTLSG
jgi:hypothetical protein